MWSFDRRHLAALIVALLSCSLAGCYTLLRHPKTGDVGENMDFATCTDCHPSYFYPGPYAPVMPHPQPPWWYPPVIVTNEGGVRRTVVDREKVERREEEDLYGRRGIETTPPLTPVPGASLPPAGGVARPLPNPPSSGESPVIKRETRSTEGGGRPIENKGVEKKDTQDSQRSGAKEKKRQ